ncbi:PREDICTED: G-type lectin S-receptor-like serine/threonine-protein kinase At1g67520 [Ipomoea nil]|uniref:G-type lectin S-receptor-like serine/threonine-protein kinase At1g67520 n=1 Tax=Ipomoea nil TaxID=35883 RepID=UPI0009017AEF|nr:PREDICTED: G-type lectin S-receptor-like serine/threonine-protein kinase At1g67520 [Ipomoea nil]
MLYDSLVVGIIVVFFICGHVSAKDALAPGEYLRSYNGDFLESSNKQYRLKFVGRPGSTFTWYLCIQFTGYQFHSSSEQITVWVAWQGTDGDVFSPYLYMGEEGKLLIYTGNDFIVNNQQPSYVTNTTATLLDNGNLVLRSPGRGRRLWQSFDYPTNTWLPGMKLGWFAGLKTHHQRFLTSWTSEENPSPGAFTFGVDPNNTKQIVLMRRGIVYWHSGVWNGINFPFLHLHQIQLNNLIRYFSNQNGSYFVWNEQFYLNATFIRIHATGEVFIGFDGDLQSFKFIGFDCYNNKTSLYAHASGGCVRPKISNCSDGDWFNLTTGVTEWEQYLFNSTFGIGDCTEMCAKNCSCNAYAAVNADDGRTGCKFSSSPAYRYVNNGEALYIRNAKPANRTKLSPLHHPGADLTKRNPHHKKTLLIVALTVALLLVILAMLFLVWYMNPRKCCGCFIASIQHSNQQLAADEDDEELPFFNFKSIEMATNYFSDENKLGQGGFGPVYKGILTNGQEIVAKRLSKMSGQGIQQFKNEVLLISKLQHRNLVRLLGCCTQGDERILIYEYLPNKSLDSILFDARKKVCLDWRQRFCIMDVIAQGLLYLHKYSRLRIIHRDLKTSNILLDVHMHPKISDFGTARIFKDNDSRAKTKVIVGTYGYMSPEYAMDGLFSEKSDVFSFGVMILEIVSGKRNNGFYNPNRVSNLLGYAWDLWIEGRISDLIDPTMDKMVSTNEAPRCIQVGLLCVQESATDRPNMSDVVSMLGTESVVLPTPKQPGFSTIIGLKCENVGNNPKACSVNEVTISEIEGR